ncbi:hypothetical protein H2200_001071 [Cladophialophora chaetospira]|uniref:Uncharacterized protein n=1 Tax=Cladophialophora chaetospira TaxID=386627 RepID=A0AA38XK62_9EURO|nr:hypothetical protein H2200_001071 [Cladophialophora chaetospira]
MWTREATSDAALKERLLSALGRQTPAGFKNQKVFPRLRIKSPHPNEHQSFPTKDSTACMATVTGIPDLHVMIVNEKEVAAFNATRQNYKLDSSANLIILISVKTDASRTNRM